MLKVTVRTGWYYYNLSPWHKVRVAYMHGIIVEKFLRVLKAYNMLYRVKFEVLETRHFSWNVDANKKDFCQQQQYGSCPSVTQKMKEQHLSSLNNKMQPALEDWPTSEACCTGRLPAIYTCHSKLEERLCRKTPCMLRQPYLTNYLSKHYRTK